MIYPLIKAYKARREKVHINRGGNGGYIIERYTLSAGRLTPFPSLVKIIYKPLTHKMKGKGYIYK